MASQEASREDGGVAAPHGLGIGVPREDITRLAENSQSVDVDVVSSKSDSYPVDISRLTSLEAYERGITIPEFCAYDVVS